MAKFFTKKGGTSISKGIEDAGNETSGEETPLVDRTEHLIETVEDELGELTNAEDLAVASTEGFGGLVSMYAVGKASLKNGGLNRNGIMLLDIGCREIVKKFSYETNSKIYSSLEAFGGASSRERATVISLEGVGSTISNWFKNIIEFLMSLGDKIKGVMVKLFNSAGRMKKLVASTKAKAEGLSGSPNPKEYEDAGVAAALHIAGTVPVTGNLLTSVTAMAELVKSINTGFTKNVNSDSISKITDFVGNFTDKAKIREAVNQFLAMQTNFEIPNLANDAKAASRKVSDTDKYDITCTAEMLGGKTIWSVKPKPSLLSSLEAYGLEEDPNNADNNAADAAATKKKEEQETDGAVTETKDYSGVKEALKAQINITDFDPEFDKTKVKTKISCFEKPDIIKCMDAIESSFDTISALNNAIVKSEEKRRALSAAAKKASSTNINDEDANVKANASLAVDLLKAAAVSLDSFPAQAIGYIMTTTKNLVSHAEKSMSQYK